MRKLVAIVSISALPLLVTQSLASMGGGPSIPQPPEPPPIPQTEANQRTARQEAEGYYGDGYDLVAKAQKEREAGKTKNLDKRYRKALERGERAVGIDSTYYEAWNLVGFCSRQLKDYDHSLSAYGRCLGLKADYAPAREYLGEAYLELGKPDQAREQLAWLEKAKANDELGRLKAALEAWDKAHPSPASGATTPAPGAEDAKQATGAATPAPADTTTAPHDR